MIQKKRVLVVGAFRRSELDNRIGGLAFACSSLVQSGLSQQFDFLLVDSTIKSIRNRSGLRRFPSAVFRVAKCVWLMLFRRPSYVICFSSHGNSFLEKGLITWLGRVLGRRVLLFPRSGHLIRQIESSRVMRSIARTTIRSAWRVLCQSESWKRRFVVLGEETGDHLNDKYQVVENWLRDDAFAPSDTEVASSAGNRFVVGFYNRIESTKGVFDFVAAVAEANRRNPLVEGVIFGDGAHSNRLEDVLAEPENAAIRYEGWLDDDQKNRLRHIDLMLFCSHAEGFPNSLLETIALKVPTVATRVGAVPDILDDGVSGLLVDVSDCQAMTSAILTLVEQPLVRTQFAEAAYLRAKSQNSLERAIIRFQSLLK